jgi:hypothetical protein
MHFSSHIGKLTETSGDYKHLYEVYCETISKGILLSG